MLSNKNFNKSSIILMLLMITILAACSNVPLVHPTPTLSDIELLEESIATAKAMSVAEPNGRLKEAMEMRGVPFLMGKQVQYDMANNVDKEFGLSGDAELCDYYNWGYDSSIESAYFCAEVIPDGGYLERWYIYFYRADFAELYQDLMGGDVSILLIARIDSFRYERSQGNMATGLHAEWFPLY